MASRKPLMCRNYYGGDYLYLIGFDDGRVKVGRTRDPAYRYRAYTKGDVTPAWAHLFANGSGWNEYRAVQELSKAGATKIGRPHEWFVGLDRQQAIAACRVAIAYGLRTTAERQLAVLRAEVADAAWEEFKARHLISEPSATPTQASA